MRAFALTVAAALLTLGVSRAEAQSCTSPQPAPTAGLTWACIGGGWVPQSAPVAPPRTTVELPRFDQPTPAVPFRLSHRYTRGTTDVRIIGTGQLPDGVSVLFALCNEEGDGCFFKGDVRMFLSHATAKDWTDHGPY